MTQKYVEHDGTYTVAKQRGCVSEAIASFEVVCAWVTLVARDKKRNRLM